MLRCVVNYTDICTKLAPSNMVDSCIEYAAATNGGKYVANRICNAGEDHKTVFAEY